MKDWIVMFGIKLTLVCAVVATALLTGCGTTKDAYEKRADNERERNEKYAQRTIDQSPEWMIKTPVSNSAVYAAGTSVSRDYNMAFIKAKHFAYAKVCMSAGGTMDQRTKMYLADTENGSSEVSETIIRSSCKGVDITGVETSDRKVINEGGRYRAYVLVALPTGDANILRKAKDQRRLAEQTAKRAPEAFKELDQ
jgi:hypothetical protein